jgi:hypothetical protein
MKSKETFPPGGNDILENSLLKQIQDRFSQAAREVSEALEIEAIRENRVARPLTMSYMVYLNFLFAARVLTDFACDVLVQPDSTITFKLAPDYRQLISKALADADKLKAFCCDVANYKDLASNFENLDQTDRETLLLLLSLSESCKSILEVATTQTISVEIQAKLASLVHSISDGQFPNYMPFLEKLMALIGVPAHVNLNPWEFIVDEDIIAERLNDFHDRIENEMFFRLCNATYTVSRTFTERREIQQNSNC